MEDGKIPPVVSEGMVFCSDRLGPVFLEGDIPPEAISVIVYDSGYIDGVFIQAFVDSDHNRDVYTLSEESNGAFAAVGERSFAELGVQQMRDAVLTRLDETLAPFAQEPKQL